MRTLLQGSAALAALILCGFVAAISLGSPLAWGSAQPVPTANYVLSGTVRDAAAGWPFYGSISISGTNIWNDPVTGAFSVTIPGYSTYTATSWIVGYDAVTKTVTITDGDRVESFALSADANTCAAPGYRRPGHWRDFELDAGSYYTTGTTSFDWGIPTSGPASAHSGANVWATNLNGNYGNMEDGYLVSPDIDLSAYAGESIVLNWWQWLSTQQWNDYASVEVSADGGVSWSSAYGWVNGDIDLVWTQHYSLLGPTFAVSNFKVRFHLWSDYSTARPGWYIDDISVGPHRCDSLPGGMVVGNVLDANTGAALAGARIVNDGGWQATSASTVDPIVADSFFALFSASGSHPFTATLGGGYSPSVVTPTVVVSSTTRQDLLLPAGRITFVPPGIDITLTLGTSATIPLTLTNSGGSPASFQLHERFGLNEPLPARPLAEASEGPRDSPWTSIADYPLAVSDVTAAAFAGRAYAIGGYSMTTGITSTAYTYDPSANSWSPIASMSVPRKKPAAAFVGDRLYVVGGWDNSYQASTVLEIYDPIANTWNTGPVAPVAYGGSVDGWQALRDWWLSL